MAETTDEPDYIGHRQRLKERFLKDKGDSFRDYELLELLLMHSIPRKDVKPISRALIRQFGGLAGVLYASKEELCSVSGVKESTYLLLKAITETMERVAWANLQESDLPVLLTHEKLLDYCRSTIAYSKVEELLLIYLDSGYKVMSREVLFRGSVDTVPLYTREIVQAALAHDARGLIVVHNHPSGNTSPSKEDEEMTKQLVNQCSGLKIEVLDHLIIGRDDYYSFREHGKVFVK